MVPEDLVAAADLATATLGPALDRDWSVRAGALDWSCRRTLDHMIDALLFFSAHIATRAIRRLPSIRNGDADRSTTELLTVLDVSAAITAELLREFGPDERAFHPAGMADRSGYLGVACEEVVMHTADIAAGLGISFAPPDELSRKIVARIFPWAPNDVPVWDALLWSTGHIALPNRERQDANWYWWCAPLSEWNGAVHRRLAPPNWR